MSIHVIDPLEDPRWRELVAHHPSASVFHSPEWLRTLQETYGYRPLALSNSDPGDRLENGIVFCEVRSWVTGNRIVSLPFSDHCEPLVNNIGDLEALLTGTIAYGNRNRFKYVEIRPVSNQPCDNFTKSGHFSLHQLDIRPSLLELQKDFHRSCVRQKIQRAQREGLLLRTGHSHQDIENFYQLVLLTRARQHVPPQPFTWFANLARNFGHTMTVHLAQREDAAPVAGLLTLKFRNTVVFKYSASDMASNNLGGNVLVYWAAIKQAKESEAFTIDLGRVDPADEGLVAFKEHWGAVRQQLAYYRYPKPSGLACHGWTERMAQRAFGSMPSRALAVVGQLLYRHVG